MFLRNRKEVYDEKMAVVGMCIVLLMSFGGNAVARCIGIDLGTTNSEVASLEGGRPEAAENSEGNKITPSVVFFSPTGPPVEGDPAKNMILAKPHHVVVEVKRMMGMDVDAFTHPDTHQAYSPEEISALILGKLKSSAEQFWGEEAKAAVISVPAYFENAGREATRKAAKLAGLEVLAIRSEPVAAAIAYRHQHPDMPDGKYVVADLGGGTFDITVIEFKGDEILTITTEGHRRTGGTDFTRSPEEWILEEFRQQHKIEFDSNDVGDAAFLQDIREKAERAKTELSKLDSTTIHFMAKGVQLTLEITREEFEKRCQPFIDRIRKIAVKAIQDGAGSVENLKGIILVGGATRMRCIQDMAAYLAQGKVPVLQDVPKDLAVAFGCAIEAYRLSGQAEYALPLQKVTEVTAYDIGVACLKAGDPSGKMYVRCMIPKGTPVPVTKTQEFGMVSMPAGSGHEAELIIAQGADMQEYDESLKVEAFSLADFPPSQDPKERVIRVTVPVDESGIISPEALHIPTGKTISHQLKSKAI